MQVDIKINATVEVHVHGIADATGAPIMGLLNRILNGVTAMSKEMDDLTASVSRNTSVLGSMQTLVTGLRDQITAAGTDPAKLAAITASLTSADDLAQAVIDNTPAAPAPGPV